MPNVNLLENISYQRYLSNQLTIFLQIINYMKAKLIVFDIAGTTLKDNEDVVSAAFLKALKKNGFELSSNDINWVMGYRKKEAISMLLKKEEAVADAAKIDEIHDLFVDEVNQHYRKADIMEIEGMSDLFRQLKDNGAIIALNTGFSRSTADIIIDRIGWLKNGLIDDSITSDEVDFGRPEPNMIHELRNRFDISNPELVYKIGDTPSDLLEGKNAGCGKTIGVLYGTHSRSELEEYPHDYLAEDVQDLLNAIISNDS